VGVVSEQTPEGDPIDTVTMWLDFGDEGETAISLDLTKFNAAMRRLGTREDPRPSP
jgi:hypothetical protein